MDRAGRDDEAWMRRALELAARGATTVSPNPLVGCVLVRGGAAVGEGWHSRAGGPHAEVVALAAAGPLAAGATAYVTLEPCDHTGATPPCTRALLAAGVARVVVAIADPNPLAAGGAARLRAAGLTVDVGPGAAEAAWQNRVFLAGLRAARPWVVLKTAASLDGRSAAADGSSQWITGPEARARAHRLRAEVDAVLVGSGTVLADDPRLTVRLPGSAGPQPLRVVLDARRRVPPGARVFDGAAPTLLLTAEASPAAPGPRVAAPRPRGAADPAASSGGDPAPGLGRAHPRGVAVAAVPRATGGLDLGAVLRVLWDRGIRSVLVEGGAAVAGSFVRAGLLDELRCHLAPVLLGERGRPLLAGDGIATLAAAPRLHLQAVERAGADTLLTLVPEGSRALPAAAEPALAS